MLLMFMFLVLDDFELCHAIDQGSLTLSIKFIKVISLIPQASTDLVQKKK